MVRFVLAMLAVSGSIFAAVPEIDANMGVSAITVLTGGMLVLRSRRAKK